MGTGFNIRHSVGKKPVPISVSVSILTVIWIILWVNFGMRDLIKKGDLGDYKALIARDAAGKKSYTYGKSLFEFLNFCEKILPKYADYNLVGIEEFSLKERRAVYHLYPHMKKKNASFLLVFNKPGFKRKGYVLYKVLDHSRFILRRV
jgi:hypothetical protein